MNEVVILIPIVNMPQNRTEEQLVLFMALQLEKLIELGALKGRVDDFLKDYTVDEATNYINITIQQDALGLTNELEAVGAATCPTYKVPTDMCQYIDAVDGELKTFSAATINERLRIAMRNPKLRFRYTIMDYKKFYKQKESKLKKDKQMAAQLKNMFLTDVMGMFTEVLPQIEEGKQLATLVGTSQVTPKLNKVARELSMAYRRALKMEKNSEQLNKGVYSKLKKSYTEFMTELLEQVFPGMNESQKQESRKYSHTSDGRIDLFAEPTPEQLEREAEKDTLSEEERALREDLDHFEEESQKEYSRDLQAVTFMTSNPTQLTAIVNAIGECGNGGHSFEIVIDPDSTEEEGGNRKFGWDGDGSDYVEVQEQEDTKEFSFVQIPVHKMTDEQAEKLKVQKEAYICVTGIKLIPHDNKMDISFKDQRFKNLEPRLIKEIPGIDKGSSAKSAVEDHKIALIITDKYKLAKIVLADDLGQVGGVAYPMSVSFSDREKVSAEDLKKAKEEGVVQKKPNGSWGIISIDAEEWWQPDYESKKKAENALKAYHANKFFSVEAAQDKVNACTDKARRLETKMNDALKEHNEDKYNKAKFGWLKAEAELRYRREILALEQQFEGN